MTETAPRRAALVAGAALFAIYLATLAPGVTLWDAGEFASAVESLGIPHPPGTPLYVLVARAWRVVLPMLGTVQATNLLAAVSTAAAGAIAAALVTRWVRDAMAGVAAGLAFGGMSTVWLNATETEVYSASLLLSMLMLYVGELVHRRAAAMTGATRAAAAPSATAAVAPSPESRRMALLLAYLFALAPPLHLSTMVAAPGAIALASVDADLRVDVPRATLLLAAAMLAAGIGTASLAVGGAGAALLVTRALWLRGAGKAAVRDAVAVIAVTAVATSVFLFLLLRARHDPALNQGNPATFRGVIDVVARTQYDVPGLWPRRAPLWLQVGNFFQYVDWQFALGLDRWVGASWRRTPVTLLFVGLGVAGSVAHSRRDRRSWAALLILVAAATLGVVVYLNLRAGPSYGYGVLPADADREARERDYFFALGFAVFGIWVGQGAVALARSVARWAGHPRVAWVGLAVAALPFALNWRAIDRRREPDASLPAAFARATLESAPPRAVLFVAGDNDSYPLWYAQIAGHVRPDVTLVTVPLLGASWYRAELARRAGLYDAADTAAWRGSSREAAAVARHAVREGRPVAAAVALEPAQRAALGDAWALRGLIYVRRSLREADDGALSIDAAAASAAAARVSQLFPGPVDPARLDDPAARYLTSLLRCPALARAAARGAAADSARLLASPCNFR